MLNKWLCITFSGRVYLLPRCARREEADMLATLQLGPWQVSAYLAAFTLALLVGGLWAFSRLLSLPRPPGVIDLREPGWHRRLL